MNRREKMLAAIDPSHGKGLEVGLLENPIGTREMGEVRYVDHASTEQLRAKNRDNPFVKVDRIVDVDYFWGDSSLPEPVAAEAPFDYVVASRVVEHVPDLVGWLGEGGPSCARAACCRRPFQTDGTASTTTGAPRLAPTCWKRTGGGTEDRGFVRSSATWLRSPPSTER